MISEEACRAGWSPGGTTPMGAAMGAAPMLAAPDPPAQPIPLTGDIACDQRSRPQESPGLAGLLGEEISNLSENQTAESEQREEKKKTQETKPKLTPFVIENTQCGESSLGGQDAFCRGNPK